MSTSGIRHSRKALLVMLLAAALAGCGSSGERKNSLRPPSPINISVKIGDDHVSAAPSRFGAGPIIVIASNQSSASHTLTIDGPQLKQSVGPINPQDTATLKVTVKPGDYTLNADGSTSVAPAKLTVGTKRPSAQNKLLEP